MDFRKRKNFDYTRHQRITAVKFGERGSVPIEQAPAKDFNLNPDTGRPMSDIQRLVRIQNDVAMQAAFSQLQEFKANFLPAEISDADALKFACPRLAQLPSELLSYREGLTKFKLQQEQLKAERDALVAREKADAEYLESLKQISKS